MQCAAGALCSDISIIDIPFESKVACRPFPKGLIRIPEGDLVQSAGYQGVSGAGVKRQKQGSRAVGGHRTDGRTSDRQIAGLDQGSKGSAGLKDILGIRTAVAGQSQRSAAPVSDRIQFHIRHCRRCCQNDCRRIFRVSIRSTTTQGKCRRIVHRCYRCTERYGGARPAAGRSDTGDAKILEISGIRAGGKTSPIRKANGQTTGVAVPVENIGFEA